MHHKSTFIPFADAKRHAGQVVVVDSYHPAGVALSHWKGAPPLAGISADTSTEIVLKALEKGLPETQMPFCTNNHFDIDGFLGVWALHQPDLALAHQELLILAAKTGDFREFEPHHPQAEKALQLVCWINKAESEHFYRPFDSMNMEGNEASLCIPKYQYFLKEMKTFLQNPGKYETLWRPELEQVLSDLDMLEKQGKKLWLEEASIYWVESPRPVHYYALFSGTEEALLVASQYEDYRYELEYKYTSWVDTSRQLPPRIKTKSLVDKLNELEENGDWFMDKITDTGPVLRLENYPLDRASRYASPYLRTIAPSSIDPDRWKTAVCEYFAQGLKALPKKGNWTWEEIKGL